MTTERLALLTDRSWSCAVGLIVSLLSGPGCVSMRVQEGQTSAAAQASTAPSTPLPPIAADRIGRRIVAAVRPQPGERAVIVYDPAYYPAIADQVQAELLRAGVHPVARLAFDPPELVRSSAGGPAQPRLREDEYVSLVRPVFEQADLFFWLPTRALHSGLRWERLIDAGSARSIRGIHFHWILPLEGRSSEEIATLTRMYQRAILETDYAALSVEQDRLIAALRGRAVRITNAAGTDLRLTVPADAWFHKNDGDMSPERARAARSVRDREMEFPAGALRFIPDVGSVEGRLVLPRSSSGGAPASPTEGVTLEFEAGRVRRWRVEGDETPFRALWERIGGDVDRVGEIVLGTNSLLVGTLSSGELPYYGYGAGYVRVSLGDNWESGGSNRSPGGRPLWLFLEGATVEAGGRLVIREGTLVR